MSRGGVKLSRGGVIVQTFQLLHPDRSHHLPRHHLPQQPPFQFPDRSHRNRRSHPDRRLPIVSLLR